MSKIMSAIQIINETFEYYTEKVGRRAIQGDRDTCMYNGQWGEHCAIGRCLLPAYQDQGMDLLGNDGSISGLVESNELASLDNMLQPQYRGQHPQFWDKLQSFHDNDYNWDTEDKVTSRGIKHIDDMKVMIESNGYGQ